MIISRVKKHEIQYLNNPSSFLKNLAYIAKDETDILGVIEIEIFQMVKAKIINFKVFNLILKNIKKFG